MGSIHKEKKIKKSRDITTFTIAGYVIPLKPGVWVARIEPSDGCFPKRPAAVYAHICSPPSCPKKHCCQMAENSAILLKISEKLFCCRGSGLQYHYKVCTKIA